MVTPELLLPDKTTQWYSYQIGISNSKCNNTFSDSEPVVASNKASKTRKLNRHYLILLSRLLPEKKETKSRESKKVTVVKLNHLILTYSPLSSEEYAESFSPYTSIWGQKNMPYSWKAAAAPRRAVECSVPWPLYRSEAEDDLLLLQNCPLFICKSCYSHAIKPLTRSFICDKHWGRIVTKQGPFRIKSIQRPGHWAHNYKNGLL